MLLAPAFASVPELPRVYLDTTYSPPAGNTITVNAGGNLQAAIDNARPGDTIVLQAGATFTGPFTLPDKGSSNAWIYVRSSAIDRLPSPGNRVSPSNAGDMATIVSGAGSPSIALYTQDGAHHFRFVGIEFRPAAGVFATALIRLGSGSETSLGQIPHHIVIDRCYIHGDAFVGGRRGIALNSASSAVIDSHVSDWKEVGADSQAIAGWSGPGPFKIVNNHLEGAAENVMFGGADALIANLVPADIEIRGNRFFKPVAWRAMSWSVKNLFELKNARRVLVEGNIFEYTWLADQNFAINIKSANDANGPWSVTEDFTFRGNIVRHAPGAIKFCGATCDAAPTAQGARYLVQNNLFDDISAATWGGPGTFLQTINATPDLVVNHNTVIHDGSTFSGGDGAEGSNTGFQFTDNIVQRGQAGFKGSGAGEGNPTLDRFFPESVFTRNAIVGAGADLYPADNYFPASYGDGVGFVDFARGDYRLASGSPYRSAANDGGALGADMTAVNAATACALGGQCGSPSPSPPVVNPFTFVDQTGVQPGAIVTSNIVTITGANLTLPATISISGAGSYSIGCNLDSITTTAMIRAGQTLCVRHRAPFTANAATSTTITVDGVSATFRSTVDASVPQAVPNLTGLWWNPAESGWGINFAHQGDLMFGTLFIYDGARSPMWLVMPAGRRQSIAIDDSGAGLADLGVYAGPLYRTAGPPFDAVPFAPIGPGNITQVGEMRVTFGTNATTLDYTVGGSRVTKSIRKQVFGARAADCRATTASRAAATNFQDLWWNPAESGWGLGIAHQGATIFATLFTYAADGTGLWLVMSGGRRQADGAYAGDLYSTSGSAFDAQTFTPQGHGDLRTVGSMRLRFANGESGTLEYSVDGIGVTKAITRQVFGNPLVECAS